MLDDLGLLLVLPAAVLVVGGWDLVMAAAWRVLAGRTGRYKATCAAGHEVERIAKLMHEAFRRYSVSRPDLYSGNDMPWETLQQGIADGYRFVARAVIDDPGRRM